MQMLPTDKMEDYTTSSKREVKNFKHAAGIILLLILIMEASGYILRLPCKQMASFFIRKDGKVLRNSVIASYVHQTLEECEFKCLDNLRCKSINMELSGVQRCELNDKTTEDIRDRVSLSPQTGWAFLTTDYKTPWIGDNCRNVKPCKEGVLCTDTCSCLGYKCNRCNKNQFGLHCYEALKDCDEVSKAGVKQSGVYPISTTNQTMMVYCDLSTANTGWIVIQRRVDATTSFDRNWTDYKRGFGNITHNYWMGLDKIHQLAGPGRGAKLKIEMRHRVNRSQAFYAEYEKFEVESEAANYRLSLAAYSGDAGDALLGTCNTNKSHISCLHGMRFSTKDRDNDESKRKNCAEEYHGGWWYRSCLVEGNLNTLHGDIKNKDKPWSSMTWFTLHNRPAGVIYSEMKIKYNKRFLPFLQQERQSLT